MKRIITLTLLLSATMIASAQKMTIKTASGQTVEISCDGMMPAEVQVEGDKVTFKMNNTAEAATEAPKAEVAETEMTENSTSAAKSETAPETTEVPKAEVSEAPTENATMDGEKAEDTVENSLAQAKDSVDSAPSANSLVGTKQSLVGMLANGLAEELSPEYKAFNEEHANDNPQEVLPKLAKNLVGEKTYEDISFLASLFKGLRFTKDSTFVPTYEQRKPKPAWRHYDVVELSGSFGRNIEGISDAMAEKVSEADYGDDTENENKFGGGIKYSRVYLKGTETDGKWQPNKLGFAWSWGGLIDYSYEKDMGSHISAMGKVGVQIGHDIVIGIDGLLGGGVTPYNTFYTNGVNHSLLKKSAFCLKYGVQLWGSLNFTKDTYTAIYGRYIRSAEPSSAVANLPKGWEMIVEDFDPSSWGVGLAVGYKFGAPEALSTDKRLQTSFSTGFQFIGKQKGLLVSSELERLTKVSHSTSLNYGLSVEQLFDHKERFSSVLLSAGFKVNQPENPWFWGAKLYGGVGDYTVTFSGDAEDASMANASKKLCGKAALQLSGGFKLGKLSELFAACRFGGHIGKSIKLEGLNDSEYGNLNGFEADARLGYRYTF